MNPYPILSAIMALTSFIYLCRVRIPRNARKKTKSPLASTPPATTGGTQQGTGTTGGSPSNSPPPSYPSQTVSQTAPPPPPPSTPRYPTPYQISNYIQNPAWKLENGEMYLDSNPFFFYGDNLMIADGVSTIKTVNTPDTMVNTQGAIGGPVIDYTYIIDKQGNNIVVYLSSADFYQQNGQWYVQSEEVRKNIVATYTDGVFGVATGRMVKAYNYENQPIIMLEYWGREGCVIPLLTKNNTIDWITAGCPLQFVDIRNVKYKI